MPQNNNGTRHSCLKMHKIEKRVQPIWPDQKQTGKKVRRSSILCKKVRVKSGKLLILHELFCIERRKLFALPLRGEKKLYQF